MGEEWANKALRWWFFSALKKRGQGIVGSTESVPPPPTKKKYQKGKSTYGQTLTHNTDKNKQTNKQKTY